MADAAARSLQYEYKIVSIWNLIDQFGHNLTGKFGLKSSASRQTLTVYISDNTGFSVTFVCIYALLMNLWLLTFNFTELQSCFTSGQKLDRQATSRWSHGWSIAPFGKRSGCFQNGGQGTENQTPTNGGEKSQVRCANRRIISFRIEFFLLDSVWRSMASRLSHRR